MKPREQRIVTAFINTVKQNVYTVDQVILMAEDFYNRHMLTEDALEELYECLTKWVLNEMFDEMGAEQGTLSH